MARDNVFRDLVVCGFVIFILFALNGSVGELLFWTLAVFGCSVVLARIGKKN